MIVRGERLTDGINGLDWLMIIWSAWALISSIFHNDPSSKFVNHLGLTFNACGIYFLFRVFCQSLEDIKNICRLTAILLVLVAVEMIYEKMTGFNLFYELFGDKYSSTIREGRIRAQGPFAHAILAGTIGAVCLPLIIGIWESHRKSATIGFLACITMIFASASSGPILSAMVATAVLLLWRIHPRPKIFQLILWFVVVIYIALYLVMEAPPYYLMGRMDLAGGSSGFHRSALIESAFKHLNEWWLGGTDYTRHWIPTGVSWSPNHTDITNHYLQMGVIGGLPLMLLFIATLGKGFSLVGKTLQQASDMPQDNRFMVWSLGASLFAHAVTFISVSYFDQSFLFIYLTLAAIGSAWSSICTNPVVVIGGGEEC